MKKATLTIFLLAVIMCFISPGVLAQQNDKETRIKAGDDSSFPIPITTVAIATLHLAGYPDFLAVEGKDIWVTNEKRIEKLSQGHSTPVMTVPLSNPCGAMVAAFGSLWVANCDDKSIYRVDSKSGKVMATIHTGLANKYGELSLAAGAGSVWVLSDSSGVLTRIDAHTNTIAATIRVQPFSYCAAFGYGAVWITSPGPIEYHKGGVVTAAARGLVQKIDPATNQVVATIPAGFAPNFLATGENGVWVLNQADGTVSRIDPHTNAVSATIDAKAAGSGGDIDAGAGSVWLRGNKTFFLKTIDPKTNRVAKHYGPLNGSGAVRVAKKLVWVSAHDVNTIWMIPK